MMTPMASAMAYPIGPPHGLAECYGTERYGTERKNLQDPIENLSVTYPPTPVDNRVSRIDPDWEAAYLECERQGMSASEIALRFGVDKRTVTRWRSTYGQNHGSRAVPRPMSDRETAERLLADGCSLKETARTLGVARQTIARWFPGLGWSRSEAGQHSAAIRFAGRAAA